MALKRAESGGGGLSQGSGSSSRSILYRGSVWSHIGAKIIHQQKLCKTNKKLHFDQGKWSKWSFSPESQKSSQTVCRKTSDFIAPSLYYLLSVKEDQTEFDFRSRSES